MQYSNVMACYATGMPEPEPEPVLSETEGDDDDDVFEEQKSFPRLPMYPSFKVFF